MNIIFMGTPAFAVPALRNLIESKEHCVKAVFTRAPTPQGRGMKLTRSPVHELAAANNIDVYTPATLKSKQTADLINSLEADIIVVVAYGFIVPKNILEAKKYGCLNIHPSKLPKHRGASPLQRTIINGDSDTAVCIMQMDEGLDTGDVILQRDLALSKRVTLKELHDLCADIGGELLLEVLDNIDTLKRVKQSEHGISYADKLTKEEALIDWQDDAYAIDCRIRGMNPWPGAYFKHKGKNIKILEADWTDKIHNFDCGEIMNDNFEIACGKGTLIVKYLKPEGKPKMLASDYLRGL